MPDPVPQPRPNPTPIEKTAEQRAKERLRAAGLSEEFITVLLSSGTGWVEDTPDAVLQTLVMSDPHRVESSYTQALIDWDLRPGTLRSLDEPTAYGPGGQVVGRAALDQMAYVDAAKGYRVSKVTGALRYNNGVIANPEAQQVIYPPNDPEAVGSPAWLQKIQRTWDTDKINEWRRKLLKFGYDEVVPNLAAKGGIDQSFLAAISEYHKTRYLNFGKAVPVSDTRTKVRYREMFDPAEVENEVVAQFRAAFGDDPSDAELESWSGFVKKTALKLANKRGYEPEAAAVATQHRFMREFRKDPKVELLAEAEEENTTLRDGMIRIAQGISGM